MNKIVIAVFALIAVAAAEPPSSYGAPSPIFRGGGGGGGFDGGSEAFVDSELLRRVAQILEQSEASSSSRGYAPPSDSYGPPSLSNSYGPPTRNVFGGGPISLGHPERAQRIAEFDLSSSSGGFRGGYSNSGGGYN